MRAFRPGRAPAVTAGARERLTGAIS